MRNPILSLLFVAASALAGAQGLPSAPHLDLEHRGAFLLNDPKVQSVIDLSGSQKAELNQVFRMLSDRQNSILQGSARDDKGLIQADRIASEQALDKLTPPQRVKLFHVAVRAAGVPGLVAPDVVTKLGLKPAQVKKIRAALDDADQPMIDLETTIAAQVRKDPKHINDVVNSYKAERKRREKARLADQQKALAFLTPAQLQTWKSLGS